MAIPLVPIILGVLAIFVVVVLYYFFIYVPTKKIEDLIRWLHFRKDKFQEDVRPSTFEFYDKKITKLVFVFMLVLAAIVMPAIFGVPPPYNIITTLVAMVIASLASVYYREHINNIERDRNINMPYGSMITYYPGEGDSDELWRRMDLETEVILGNVEKDELVDQIVEGVKTMPSFNAKTFKEKETKKIWRERLDKFRAYRFKVKDRYSILYVTPHAFSESKTQNTRSMLDETQWVRVNMVPAFNLYCDTTRKVFKTVDDKGRPGWGERTMGVFVGLYDIKSRDDDMREGKHTVLTKTDQLLAAHMHLYDQRQMSARDMTKSLRDLEKTNLELEERRFDEQAEAAQAVANIGDLLKELNISTESTVTIEDKGTVALLAAIFFCIGAVSMYLVLILMSFVRIGMVG